MALEARQPSSASRHYSLVRSLCIQDLVTLLNGAFGLVSIFSSCSYLSTNNSASLVFAIWMLPLSLFADFLDGKIARYRNTSSLMGKQLDSFCDLVSFGLAPTLLGFAIGLQEPLDILFLVFYTLAAILRLARFNITVARISSHGFQGVPSPFAAFVATGVVYGSFIWNRMGYETYGGVFHTTIGSVHALTSVYFVLGIAMLSKTLHVPKP